MGLRYNDKSQGHSAPRSVESLIQRLLTARTIGSTAMGKPAPNMLLNTTRAAIAEAPYSL